MASVTKARTVGGATFAVAKGTAVSEETGNTNFRAQDEAEGDRLSEQVEKRIMDIKMGRVKMTRYTPDEYMRHLDDILGG